MQPPQASELACVFLTGTSEELAGPKVLEGAVVGVAAPSDLAGSILVKILHSIKGGAVKQGCSSLERILPCLCLLSLYLSLVFIYLHNYIASLYMLDISCA